MVILYICPYHMIFVNYQLPSCLQIVFFGFLTGAPVWGAAADKFGRKRVSYKKNYFVTCDQIHTLLCTYFLSKWK